MDRDDVPEERGRKGGWLTLLEAVELFANRLLVPLALAQPLVLDFLAKLFRVAQLARVLARLHARLLVEQRLSDLSHVRVRLDHLGKVVGRAVERQRGLFEEGLGVHCCPQRLLVAAVVVGSHEQEFFRRQKGQPKGDP